MIDPEVVDKARRTHDRLETEVGHTRTKRRQVSLTANLAWHILTRADDYTIDWRRASDEMKRAGHATIWHYIAWLHPLTKFKGGRVPGLIPSGEAPTDADRFKSSFENYKVINVAFDTFRHEFWRDFHGTLYMVPRQSDTRGVEVITLNGDFPVNDEQVARELLGARTSRQVESANVALWKQAERTHPDDPMPEYHRLHAEADRRARERWVQMGPLLPPVQAKLGFGGEDETIPF